MRLISTAHELSDLPAQSIVVASISKKPPVPFRAYRPGRARWCELSDEAVNGFVQPLTDEELMKWASTSWRGRNHARLFVGFDPRDVPEFSQDGVRGIGD